MQDKINIELAYASEQKQFLISYQTQPGLKACEIIKNSGILDIANINDDIHNLSIGVWSKLIKPDTIINLDNSRIEIYRKLKCDPKESRKKRAYKK